jgi:hypothetical protein
MKTNINTKILALAVLPYYMFFTSCTESQEGYVVPINSKRHVTMLTVKIGNVEIPKILFDTGMSFDGILIYNPDYRDSIKLPNAVEVKVPGAGDDEPSHGLMIDPAEFMLGDITMKNQKIIVLQNDIFKGFPSNGVIGYSVLGHYVTKIDYDKDEMTLFDSGKVKIDNRWTEIPMYFKKNIPWIDAKVVIGDEEPILLSMYIDYASSESIELLEKPEMKFSLPEETEDAYLGRGLSGDIYGKKGRISKLIIGPYELNDVNAVFASEETRSKMENADGILGNNSLRRFNLIFDYANKKLYIKPNSHFNEPF